MRGPERSVSRLRLRNSSRNPEIPHDRHVLHVGGGAVGFLDRSQAFERSEDAGVEDEAVGKGFSGDHDGNREWRTPWLPSSKSDRPPRRSTRPCAG